jgi:hypothetical protein
MLEVHNGGQKVTTDIESSYNEDQISITVNVINV